MHPVGKNIDSSVDCTRQSRVADAPSTLQRRRRVLFVTNNRLDFERAAGAELYLATLISQLRKIDCYVLARDPQGGYGKNYILYHPSSATVQEWGLGTAINEFTVNSSEIDQLVVEICVRHGINHVVINHLIGFAPSITVAVRRIGLKYTIVLHDFFVVCDSFNLLDNETKYCGIDRVDFPRCVGCTRRRLSIEGEGQYRRRGIYAEVVTHADVVVVSHRFVFDIASRALGISHPKVKIVAPPPLFDQRADVLRRDRSKKLRIALVGNLFPNKGSYDFIAIAKQTANLGVVFEIFGRVHVAVKRRLSRADHVVFHGAFDHVSYPAAAIAQCDCALFLSIWPETHCMSLTETNALGLVPIAYKIGAFDRRITNDYGFLVEPSPSKMVELIETLPSAIEELAEKRSRIPSSPPQSKFVDAFECLLSEEAGTSPIGQRAGAASDDWPQDFDTSSWNYGRAHTIPSPRWLIQRFWRHIRDGGILSALRQAAKWLVTRS